MTATPEQEQAPRTVAEAADKLREKKHKGNVWVLSPADRLNEKVVGLGGTYEEMWENAAAAHRIAFRKEGYLCDHVPLSVAQRIIDDEAA